MKKIASILIFTVMFSFVINAASKKKINMWNEIIIEKDPAVKLQKLQEFKTLFETENDQYLHMMYTHLALTYYELKQFGQALEYSEKALQFKDIDIGNKLDILKNCAEIYATKGDNLKAIDYSKLLIENARALQTNDFLKNKFNKEYVLPALMLIVKSISAKQELTEDEILDGLKYNLEAFRLLRSNEIFKPILELLTRLTKLKKPEQPEDLPFSRFDDIYQILVELKNIPVISQYALYFGRVCFNKLPDHSLKFLQLSYNIKISAENAYWLGLRLYQNNKEELDQPLELLMQAIILDKDKKIEKLENYFSGLFEQKYKALSLAEKEAIYDQLKAKMTEKLNLAGQDQPQNENNK